MTAELRALPGLGVQHPDLPKVTRDTDDHKYAVQIDVTDQVDLQAFFHAITRDDHLRNALRILLWNDNGSPKSRDLRTSAAADMRKNSTVRRAFTLTLTPEHAEMFHEDIAASALEPVRCEVDDCDSFCQDEDDRCIDAWTGKFCCPNHLAIFQGG